MHKFILFVLASGLGSVSGLVGCKSENAEPAAGSVVYKKDVFEPVFTIEQGKGPVAVKLVTRMDLQDQLALGGATSVKTHAQCGRLAVSRTFKDAEAPTIAQVLPEEIVVRDLRTTPEPCSLHFELRNARGSEWILSHHAVTVHDDRPALLRIGRDDGTEPALNVAGAASMDGVRVRGPVTGEAVFACEDATFTGPRFEQVIDYQHFDFARPNMRPDRHPRVLAERRYELCRAFVIRDGRISAFSRPHRVQFPRTPVAIVDRPLDPAQGLREYLAEKPLVIREFELRNTEPFARRLVVEGDALLVRGEIMRNLRHSRDLSVSTVRYAFLEIPGQPDRGLARREITLPPGGSKRLRFVFQRFNTLKCNTLFSGGHSTLDGIRFTLLDPVPLTELETDGTPVGTQQLGQGVSRTVSEGPIDASAYGTVTNNCAWY